MGITENKEYVDSLVSVIMPTFNVQDYVQQAIISVFNQTYTNFELIVIDDCSTDQTVEKINELSKEYSFTFIQMQENSGVGRARNRGLEFAKGRFVAFLDGDDIWREDKLELQLSVMKERGGKLCYTAIEVIDENGKTVKDKIDVAESCHYELLLKNTVIPTSTVIVDREFFGQFTVELHRRSQDYATWLKLLRGGQVAVGVNYPLCRYRRNGSLGFGDKLEKFKNVWAIQTKQEGINPFKAFFNILSIALTSFKKNR